MTVRHAALALTAATTLTLLLGVTAPLALAQGPEAADEFDDEAPDEGYVWVDGGETEDGAVVEGFYRVRTREGYEVEKKGKKMQKTGKKMQRKGKRKKRRAR